jgi:[acyl-carrier-protein] S-malonyltransferase
MENMFMAAQGKIAILFPGQGSQFLGMGREFLEADPEAAALMATAEEVSGFPLRRLCLEGPMEELTRTVHLQPAMTVINLICWQAVKKAGIRPDYLAGHSLGEYSALCAAGVLTPADTLRLVTERGRLMEREASRNPGSMRAVLGLTLDEVREVLATVSEGVVAAANHNSEKQVVISGEAGALEAAAAEVGKRGGKAVVLKVSGAWHSPLVQAAVDDFSSIMAATSFQAPRIPVLFNVTAREEREPEAIRAAMARQIAAMVRWHEIVNELLARGVRTFIEVGPKTVLTGLLKKIVPADSTCTFLQVESPETLARAREEIGTGN